MNFATTNAAPRAIEDVTGEGVYAYLAPSFSITAASEWALDVLIEEGFTVDSSIYPTHHDRYGMAGTPLEPHRIRRAAGYIWKFPPPVCPVMGYPLPVGGGGYFRLFPYSWTRAALRDQRRGSALRGLSASVGTRSRATASVARLATGLPTLRQPAPHRGAPASVAARLCTGHSSEALGTWAGEKTVRLATA